MSSWRYPSFWRWYHSREKIYQPGVTFTKFSCLVFLHLNYDTVWICQLWYFPSILMMVPTPKRRAALTWHIRVKIWNYLRLHLLNSRKNTKTKMMLTVFKWCLSGPVGQRSRDQGRVGRPLSRLPLSFTKLLAFGVLLVLLLVLACVGQLWFLLLFHRINTSVSCAMFGN